MELKLTIPNNLNEITLRQYKEYLKVGEENDDLNFIQGKMIETFVKL